MTQDNFNTKTPYEWCLEYNIRIIDLTTWPYELDGSNEKHYFEYRLCTEELFREAIKSCTIKTNSRPRKTNKYLEWRMYGLVPYNISSVQTGIQYGHALQEFNNLMFDGYSDMQSANMPRNLIESYVEGFNLWRKKYKTFIILNGGTTNDMAGDKWYGTLQKHRDILIDNDVLVSEFYEPDLNYALSGIVFLVDERVFDRESYPNFEPETLPYNRKKPSQKELDELEQRNKMNYEQWVDKVGGERNVFLRDFLKQFKLAT